MGRSATEVFSIVLLSGLFIFSAGAQSAEERTWEMPRTPEGHPDMQGTWFYGSATPFERPAELGRKQSYTDQEAFAIEQAASKGDEIAASPLDLADRNFAEQRINLTRIGNEYRTSLIVDPPDGMLPYREGGMDIFDRWSAAGFGAFDGPETRPTSERCLDTLGPMPPMIGWFYNANMQIVQSSGYVVIKGEMHPPRIIPLAREHDPHGLRKWMGDSIGQWESDTFVVHTKNFRPEQSWGFFKLSSELEIVERYTLVSEDEIFYQYVVTDPQIYALPFTVEMSIIRRRAGERIYEYACHEANYSLRGILAGARMQELDED